MPSRTKKKSKSKKHTKGGGFFKSSSQKQKIVIHPNNVEDFGSHLQRIATAANAGTSAYVQYTLPKVADFYYKMQSGKKVNPDKYSSYLQEMQGIKT